MSTPLKPGDPAYWMLEQGRKDATARAESDLRIANAAYSASCYICKDPEFALMGLPLCYHCAKCGGHVPADDTRCDICGADQQELHEEKP